VQSSFRFSPLSLHGLAYAVGCVGAEQVGRPPNKRLKLAGGDGSNGSGVLCPGGHELTFNTTEPCGRVARSLSAIR
jgi:hypothetical protein